MATAKINPVFKYGCLKISSLIGVHPQLQSLIKKLGYVGGSPFPIQTALTRDSIQQILEIAPIQVTSRGGDKYMVIGGLRQFVLAKHLLDPGDEIGVLMNHGRVNHNSMLRRFAVEYVTLPILMGSQEPREVVNRLGVIKKHLPDINMGNRDDLASLLGVSLRTLATLNEKTDV